MVVLDVLLAVAALILGLAAGMRWGRSRSAADAASRPGVPAAPVDADASVAPAPDPVAADALHGAPNRSYQPIARPAPDVTGDTGDLEPALVAVLQQLPGIVLLCDPDLHVALASHDAMELRLARRGRLAFESVEECAQLALDRGTELVREITLRRPPMRRISIDLRVDALPLPSGHVLLVLTDLTQEHRLAAVRRDFIANVSHELKTPVGAMSLLAEAIAAARDDPESVEYFAGRMQTEAQRLTSLINDAIDLSRVQGDDPLTHAEVVEVDGMVQRAVDYVHGAADIKDIAIVVGGTTRERVFGDPGQLDTALRNVLANAITYSEPGTRVAIAVRASESLVEIDVKDQGMGIPEAELDRIFERFYRVDAARSRVTGGTGLGLSIVRNVCRNHGGDCMVWSVEHEGSTFTLQFPRYLADDQEDMA